LSLEKYKIRKSEKFWKNLEALGLAEKSAKPLFFTLLNG
jgi:hypothetical protein